LVKRLALRVWTRGASDTRDLTGDLRGHLLDQPYVPVERRAEPDQRPYLVSLWEREGQQAWQS
jgi:hypothetical protein